MSKNIVEKAQDETTIEFYQYLMDIETMDDDGLKLTMQKKGLIFIWFINQFLCVFFKYSIEKITFF